MKTAASSVVLVLVLALSSIKASETVTLEGTWVGLKTEDFAQCYGEQQQNEWCWAASIQSLFKYYGINTEQKDIVTGAYGAPINAPGSNEAITRALNGTAVSKDKKKCQIRAILKMGAPAPVTLVSELKADRPLILGYINGPNSGHAVVITAVLYTGTPENPIIQKFVVRDPWPSKENRLLNGRREYGGMQLAQVSFASWSVSVQKSGDDSTPDKITPPAMIKCAVCRGTGQTQQQVACGLCHATGGLVCPTCIGNCFLACLTCGGSGGGMVATPRGPMYVACPICRRTGRVPCQNCAGRGVIFCTSCLGRKSIFQIGPCQPCGGTGLIQK